MIQGVPAPLPLPAQDEYAPVRFSTESRDHTVSLDMMSKEVMPANLCFSVFYISTIISNLSFEKNLFTCNMQKARGKILSLLGACTRLPNLSLPSRPCIVGSFPAYKCELPPYTTQEKQIKAIAG